MSADHSFAHRIADNPILYASDGFVSVTGYSRADIIPRNCRFLQGNHTDHAAVRRLKACIGANKESVELLLNYRKTGEPFWNLLYVSKVVLIPLQLPPRLRSRKAPLLDEQGRTAFFLGGQINCSTTIHNCSDLLRLLSMSEDSNVVDDPYLNSSSNKSGTSALHAFFKAFRSKNNDRYSDAPAGMEQNLISQIERMNFKEQMEMFYTAYSKVTFLYAAVHALFHPPRQFPC
jgi:phototropin